MILASAYGEVGSTSEPFSVEVASLAFAPGSIRALVGKSGAGKTTLIRTLLGLVGWREYSPASVTFGAVLHGSVLFPWASLTALVELEEEAREVSVDHDLLHEALGAFALSADVMSLRSWELSQGMRQRFELAKTLAFKPDIVFLDEAFSGVDVRTRASLCVFLNDYLSGNRTSILFVTHDLGDVIRLADSISVMRDGRITVTLKPEQDRAKRIGMDGRELIELDIAKKLAELLF